MSKFVFSFVTLAMAAASAASYEVNITSPVAHGDKTLSIGRYRVEVEGGKAIFKKGKEVFELPVQIEETPRKYDGTQVNSSTSQLQEIHVGGTHVKMIFKPAPVSVPAGGGSK